MKMDNNYVIKIYFVVISFTIKKSKLILKIT